MDRKYLFLDVAKLLLLSGFFVLAIASCNKQDSASTADNPQQPADQTAELTAVGDVGATQADILLPPDSEVSIVVDYHGWDVESDNGDPGQREHVFSVMARWGLNLHEEMREIVIREGEKESVRLDIGGGQILTISPQWNELQRGSYLFQVEEAESGELIAAFDARDTGDITSMTTPASYGHHAKTVFADLDKRIFLQEVRPGGQHDFSRESDFGLAYVGEGYKNMPICKVNENSHWHFPRFEVVACPREWMANYSFQGLGQKLSSKKSGLEGNGGVKRINWETAYRPARRCNSGG